MELNDMAKLKVMCEQLRRYRRKIESLEERLCIENESSKVFDAESEELFQIVHRNHERVCV